MPVGDLVVSARGRQSDTVSETIFAFIISDL